MHDDVAQWLADLGLSQYADSFLRQRITLEIASQLTDADLRELGVEIMGHRKLLLKAIADQDRARQHSVAGVAELGAAERRQLTVMFCDLVDSTDLQRRIGHEAYREVQREFRTCCREALKHFRGEIGGVRGDGYIVYFGYPKANEFDAERAIRAGLEIASAMPQIRSRRGVSLSCRIGIATGEVIVGDVEGSGLTWEREVTGLAPNLAARLQQLAEPNTVIVSDATRVLTQNFFQYADLGMLRLKGISPSERIWKVEKELPYESRFDATHSGADLEEMVGRQAELAELVKAWEAARQGHGSAVLIYGEAGIGKSRLIHTLRTKLAIPGQTISYYCRENQQNTALSPVVANFEKGAGIDSVDSQREKLARLEAFLGQTTDDLGQTLPLFADLLSIELSDAYEPLSLTPHLKKERTLLALEQQLKLMTEKHPMLIVLEDMHWGDPTTQELLERTLKWTPSHRLLFVATARPEYLPSWPEGKHVSAICLPRLDREASMALVLQLSGHREMIPPEVMAEIVDKCDGVPLFAEEITKTVLERRSAKKAGSKSMAQARMTIPSTLQDSLAARLDGLPGARKVAQIGATIGREFTYELIASVSPMSGEDLQHALDELTRAELLTRRGDPPDAVYRFRHALLQDWAYENQLDTQRPRMHALIATTLEAKFADEVARHPEIAAHHHAMSGNHERAIAHWKAAAGQAADRAAYREALGHLEKALAQLEMLEDGPQKDKIELDLLIAQGVSLETTLGYGRDEVKRTYERARMLCTAIGETLGMVPTLLGLYIYHLVRAEESSDLPDAKSFAEHCVDISSDANRSDFLIESRAALGYVQCYLGELDAALDTLSGCVRQFEDLRKASQPDEPQFGLAAQHPAVAARALLPILLWLRGKSDESLEALERALELAREFEKKQPINCAVVYAHASQLHQLRREPEKAAEYAAEGLKIAEEHGYPQWIAACRINMEIAKSMLGDGDDDSGRTVIEQHLQAWRAMGCGLNRPYWLAGIARAELAADRPWQAITYLSEGLDFAEKTGEIYFVPLLYELRAAARAALGSATAEIRSDFWASYRTALSQNATMFQLRALTGLHKLEDTGDHQPEVDRQLRQLVEELRNAGNSADLEEARALCC